MSFRSRDEFSGMLLGACCGIVATVPMTAAMLAIQRLLPKSSRETQEPRQITDELLDWVAGHAGVAEPHRRLTAAVAHFGYGATAGTAYPVVDRTFRRLPGRGPAYGLALFAVGYAGWLPACGILPIPPRRPCGRNVLLVASHLIWGAALQWSYSQREKPDGGYSTPAADHHQATCPTGD